MPMKGCAFLWFGDLVMNRNLDGIAPVCLDYWSGKLTVHQQDGFLISIWSYNSTLDCKVVSSDNSSIRGRSIWVSA